MKFSEAFGDAVWVRGESIYTLFRTDFGVEEIPSDARLHICGLGFFYAWLNGRELSHGEFMPLYTEYNRREIYPDCQTRTFVMSFDVSGLLTHGGNCLCASVGPGYYRYGYDTKKADPAFYGDDKLVFSLEMTLPSGKTQTVCSSPETVRYSQSHITDGTLLFGETHDMRIFQDGWNTLPFNCSRWKNAIAVLDTGTEYEITPDTVPADCEVERLTPTVIKKTNAYTVYDFGKNFSGKLVCESDATGKIEVLFSESLTADGELDAVHAHGQKNIYIGDGKKRLYQPEFTWNAFRFASVTNNAIPLYSRVIHSCVARTGDFLCSNKTINWFYRAYVQTQKSNLHCGVPSDCPHFERRGYTGDGQLTAHACMLTFDMHSFYTKWIHDIALSQDKITGRVPYTAPYIRSGGGPGGWGCAIVHIPYLMWKEYGDTEVAEKYFKNMLFYFEYLEAHSKDGLVVSDREHEWCLGDWCPGRALTMPEPFVNTYFYIRSLDESAEMAEALGKKEALFLKERAREKREIFTKNYFDAKTGNFCRGYFENPYRNPETPDICSKEPSETGGEQGANAFAVSLGLGDRRTKESMNEIAKNTKGFDSGIFGTDILLCELFRHGYGDAAVKMLSSHEKNSFGHWMDEGATTLWEYWYGKRSHSHPMFGSSTSYLFTYILGIGQRSEGYRDIVIHPVKTPLEEAHGYITTQYGKISVSIKKTGGKTRFEITVPRNSDFEYCGYTRRLHAGTNKFFV